MTHELPFPLCLMSLDLMQQSKWAPLGTVGTTGHHWGSTTPPLQQLLGRSSLWGAGAGHWGRHGARAGLQEVIQWVRKACVHPSAMP